MDRAENIITVSHFPPGTSKWNKAEHRLFCYITANWAGQPLVDVQTAARLIGSAATTTGLKVTCKLDKRSYQTGAKVSDEDFDNNAHHTIRACRESERPRPAHNTYLLLFIVNDKYICRLL